jgi:hypothetical protein
MSFAGPSTHPPATVEFLPRGLAIFSTVVISRDTVTSSDWVMLKAG